MAEKKSEECEIGDTLLEAEAGDVLELDEVWTFVQRRDNKRWLWTGLCRRTRQIVTYISGDHSAKTCHKLWKLIPDNYKSCYTFSDLWDAYVKVFSKETHRSVGKESGQTCHMERWNCTLRQKMARFTRETLSFSKSDEMHDAALKCFIYHYNLCCISRF